MATQSPGTHQEGVII